MVFFLENISEHHLITVLEAGCSGCSLAKLQKMVFNDFLLDLWANVSEVFNQDFLMIGPRILVLALRNLGRIASLFLENFTLQVTNPLVLEND